MRPFPIVAPVAALASLAACEQDPQINPPTEPASPNASSDVSQGVDGALSPMMPGAGPASFVGRWAANPAWCAAGEGERRPIVITPTEFQGFENRCRIGAVGQTQTGYRLDMTCASEGSTTRSAAHLSVSGDVLKLTWLDGETSAVRLTRCRAPGDVVPPAESSGSSTKAKDGDAAGSPEPKT